VNADCCVGTSCIAPVGGSQGTCGPCNPAVDAGSPDGGTCALYGQQCAVDGDCCDNVPCFCNNTGCSCEYPPT
jgi:hypothetical protein